MSSFSSCNPFAECLERAPKKRTPRQLAELLVDTYLRDETLADVDSHCPLIALPSTDEPSLRKQLRAAAHAKALRLLVRLYQCAAAPALYYGNRLSAIRSRR